MITVISGLVVACVAARVVVDRLLVRRVREDEAAAEDVADGPTVAVAVAALPERTP